MPIRATPAALIHPALRPRDQFRIQITLIAMGEFNSLLRLLPNDSEALFNFETVPDALRDGATKTFAKNFFLIRD
jgi:hypothetical protein